MIIVLTSADDKSKAYFIAQSLVEQKLAACVQISAQGKSVYVWEDEVCEESEYYLSIKTTSKHKNKVVTWLEANHPYDIPEIITLNVKASTQYEHWLESSLL